MKTLLLLRHAKSSWQIPGQPDHERRLNDRGHAAATQMGQWIVERNLRPDAVLCSTAVRTCETWNLVRAELLKADSRPIPEQELAWLYHCPVAGFEHLREAAPPDSRRLLVIGHNPGLEELSARLTGKPEEFTTATLAEIELPISTWSEFRVERIGTLHNIWRPKELD